jgi:hypothetical protein
MGRFLLLMPLLLFLAGCYSDQKQQLGACELQAKQRAEASDEAASSEYIELCMRAQGYEFVQDDCPSYLQTDTVPKVDHDYYRSLSQEQKDRLNIETGKKIIAIEQMQKSEPACYEPMGWSSKRTLRFEKWFGTAKAGQ